MNSNQLTVAVDDVVGVADPEDIAYSTVVVVAVVGALLQALSLARHVATISVFFS